MSLFDSVTKIDNENVASIVQKEWGVRLGKILKASQNHTFEGFKKQGQTQIKFSIRVTPDPSGKNLPRVQRQLKFVQYLAERGLNHICKPIPRSNSQDNKFIYSDKDKIISVFEWAQGEFLNFTELEWMLNKKLVQQWGRFFAKLHKLSRQFQKEHPQTAGNIQTWRQVHHGILADSLLHPDDEKEQNNPQHFGVLHGDLNCSNFFYDRKTHTLNVFDTDQVQRGFYLWDVSQAIFTSFMLENAGMPISQEPVPQADWKKFQGWIVEGYESVAGKGWIDINRLQRMVLKKKQFYVKFCTQAIKQGDIPSDMKPFIEYIANTLGQQK